jgi:hypothetical protein
MRHRVYLDPTGVEFGLPTYPFRSAPLELLTRRQLRELGLRPRLASEPDAQLMWRGAGRHRQPGQDARVASLYRLDQAVPRRPISARQYAHLVRARAARRYCPTCRRDAGYVIAASLGECNTCHFGPED